MAEAPDPARSPSRPRGSAGAARLQPYAGQADDHGQAAARCVVMTSIPAARNSPTSCRRRAILQPRSLGWARSSTRTTSGRRRSTASRSSARPCDATCPAFEEGDGVRASVALHEPGNHVRSPCGPAAALLKHPAGLAHAPSRPRGGPWAADATTGRLGRVVGVQNFSGSMKAATRYPTRATATISPTTFSTLMSHTAPSPARHFLGVALVSHAPLEETPPAGYRAATLTALWRAGPRC